MLNVSFAAGSSNLAVLALEGLGGVGVLFIGVRSRRFVLPTKMIRHWVLFARVTTPVSYPDLPPCAACVAVIAAAADAGAASTGVSTSEAC